MSHNPFVFALVSGLIGIGACIGTLAALSPKESPKEATQKQSLQSVAIAPTNKPLEFEKYLKVSSGELGCDRLTDSQGLQWHAGYLKVNGKKYSVNGVGSQLGVMLPIDQVWKEGALEADSTGALDFQVRLKEAVENVCLSKYPDTAERSDWAKIRQNLGLPR